MKYLPSDVSTFSTMITGNYLYVDKTQIIYKLFSGGDRYYFLSRPRRFGKSLLISLLKELFLSNRKLFTNLWIDTADYAWNYHPVIHLDFSIIANATPEQLSINLAWTIDTIAQEYEIDTRHAPSAEAKFNMLITHLAKRHGPNSVVVLVDEYDKPLIDHLQDSDVAHRQRSILKNFYGVLKGVDEHLRAIFITGVSKFSKTSIFSGINNLNDISLDAEVAQLLGYTQEEISRNFSEYIADIAQEQGTSSSEILEGMRTWYNGYRFSDADIKVYNPFSILYYLKKKKFLNFWIESGTPFFLIKLLKKEFTFLENLETAELSRNSLGTFDIDQIPLVTLLFQTGYLTITDYDAATDKFTLGYPNLEVKESFNKYIVAALTKSHTPAIEKAVSQLVAALKNDDIDTFCSVLESLFANIPYNLHIEQESYFHSLFQFLGTLLGLEIQSEVLTDKGRIDLVITTQSTVFVFELKFDAQAEQALQQIEKQKYYERYTIKRKKIMLVGLAFNYVDNKLVLDWKTRTISV